MDDYDDIFITCQDGRLFSVSLSGTVRYSCIMKHNRMLRVQLFQEDKMKYGESAFDILYLLFAIVSGCVILCRSKDRGGKLMGLAALLLGAGDAFHLVPRVMNYFTQMDLTAALGIGKLITSITMTVFYVILYYVWLARFHQKPDRNLTACVWGLTLVRIALCMFPQIGPGYAVVVRAE